MPTDELYSTQFYSIFRLPASKAGEFLLPYLGSRFVFNSSQVCPRNFFSITGRLQVPQFQIKLWTFPDRCSAFLQTYLAFFSMPVFIVFANEELILTKKDLAGFFCARNGGLTGIRSRGDEWSGRTPDPSFEWCRL
jgi:hypothetical protein